MTDTTQRPFRLAWATDVHLNFASQQAVAGFIAAVRPSDEAPPQREVFWRTTLQDRELWPRR